MDMKAMGSQIRHSATEYDDQQGFNKHTAHSQALKSTYRELSSVWLETRGFASADLNAVCQTWLMWPVWYCGMYGRCANLLYIVVFAVILKDGPGLQR